MLGRYPAGGKHRVYVEGTVNGRPARMPLDVDLMGGRQRGGGACAGAAADLGA
ncbi:hypothetical protein QW131_13095 [Roseibium salinum]|nr:hypothetical protein [Roseibium salinum]